MEPCLYSGLQQGLLSSAAADGQFQRTPGQNPSFYVIEFSGPDEAQ